jgi:hypothetical protein
MSSLSRSELLKEIIDRLTSFDDDMDTIRRIASRYGVLHTPEYDSLLELLKQRKVKFHKAKNKLEKKSNES